MSSVKAWWGCPRCGAPYSGDEVRGNKKCSNLFDSDRWCGGTLQPLALRDEVLEEIALEAGAWCPEQQGDMFAFAAYIRALKEKP